MLGMDWDDNNNNPRRFDNPIINHSFVYLFTALTYYLDSEIYGTIHWFQILTALIRVNRYSFRRFAIITKILNGSETIPRSVT